MCSIGKPSCVREALEMAKRPHTNQDRLVRFLREIYTKCEDVTSFREDFLSLLQRAMLVARREPQAERVLDFCARFAASFQTTSPSHSDDEDDEEVDEDEEDTFLTHFYDFLLSCQAARNQCVRVRSCQLLSRLLRALGEGAGVGATLHSRLRDALLSRAADRVPSVRAHAATALARLQDPLDNSCPVIAAYEVLVELDTSADVRRAALASVCLCARTLPLVLRRTRDIRDSIRKLAYEVLADKVHIKTLTITQRVKLLDQGLKDRSEDVRACVSARLLQAWLRSLRGDALALLEMLDVECGEALGDSVLQLLFRPSQPAELAQLCSFLDDKRMVPVESLSPEVSLYWRCLCQHLSSRGSEAQEALELVLPAPIRFSAYLKGFIMSECDPVTGADEVEDVDSITERLRKEFIADQLISLAGCLDLTDEAGRKLLLSSVQELLTWPRLSAHLVASLVTMATRSLEADDDRRVRLVAELISELREPVVSMAPPPTDPAQRRRMEMQLAGLKVRLHETREEMQQCVSRQEFVRAQQLKVTLGDLEAERQQLCAGQEQQELSQPPLQTQQRVEKTDPDTLLRCLTMFVELTKCVSPSGGLHPTMHLLLHTLVLPGIINEDPGVRNVAVTCLGCCALQCRDLAKQHLGLLFQMAEIDLEDVRCTALRAIFDLLQTFGLEAFTSEEVEEVEEEEEEEEVKDGGTNTINSILALLSSLLDGESAEVRCVCAEGLSKLLLCGRVLSCRLLSRLLLLWYNPATEDELRLRHALGVFFTAFAYSRRENQECVEEAFLPTLRTLWDAPESSPLCEVNVANVAELMVNLTRHSLLHDALSRERDPPVHESLALSICNEILVPRCHSVPGRVRVLIRSVASLELATPTSTTAAGADTTTTGRASPSTKSGDETARQLVTLLDKVSEVVKDGVSQRMIIKLRSTLCGQTKPAANATRDEVDEEPDEVDDNNDDDDDDQEVEDEEQLDKQVEKAEKLPVSASVAPRSNRKGRAKRSVASVTEPKVKSRPQRRSSRKSVSRSASPALTPMVTPTVTRPQRKAKTAALERTRSVFNHSR